jgi:Flp pilus assembly protein TadB
MELVLCSIIILSALIAAASLLTGIFVWNSNRHDNVRRDDKMKVDQLVREVMDVELSGVTDRMKSTESKVSALDERISGLTTAQHQFQLQVVQQIAGCATRADIDGIREENTRQTTMLIELVSKGGKPS